MRKIKKFGFPLLALLFSVWYSAVLSLGIVIGYFTTHFSHKKITHSGKINSVIINLGKRRLHFHHWLMAVVALVSCWAVGVLEFVPKIIVGVVGGVAFHGLYLYDNWHKIILKKEQGPVAQR